MSGTGEVAPSGRTLLLGAAEQSDVKRVEEEARWLSSGVAAADDAALQAAIDAAAASDEAGVALYEAQFGSVAVGRLLAGSLAVNQYVESTGYVPGSAGWHIDADGSAEFNSVYVRGDIRASSVNAFISISSPTIVGGTISGTTLLAGPSPDVTIDADGITILQGAATPRRIKFGDPGFGSDQVIYASTTSTLEIKSNYIQLNDSFQISPTGRPSYSGTYLPLAGTRTTAGTTWDNGTGRTGGPVEYTTYPGAHKHQTDGHTHQVYI